MLQQMTGAESRKDRLLEPSPRVAGEFVTVLSEHVKDGELFGLFNKFSEHRLTDKLESWIGRSDDVLLTPEEVGNVLGEDFLKALSERLIPTMPELSREALLQELVKVFPVVIRGFTRSGQIPPVRILQRSILDVAQTFGVRADVAQRLGVKG